MPAEYVFHPEDVVGLDMRYAVQAQHPDLFSEFMEAAADAMVARLREHQPNLQPAWTWNWEYIPIADPPVDEDTFETLAERAVEDAVDRVLHQRGLVLR